MPSAIRRLFNFSNKKKSHHGAKFHEFHGYDTNQRLPAYPTIAQTFAHQPQYFQQQLPQQQNQQQFAISYQNQHYQQAQPQQHSFSHRQQLQFQQQNSLVQSPPQQLVPALPTNPNQQCHCQQCAAVNINQLGYGQQQAQLANLGPPQTTVTSPVRSPPQIQLIDSQIPMQPAALPAQVMVPTHPIQPQPPQHQNQPLHQQQQQGYLLQNDHQVVQLQQQQPPCDQTVHQPPHQQPQFNSVGVEISRQYSHQVNEYNPQPAQCACHHCPSQAQRVQPAQNQQSIHQPHMLPQMNEPPHSMCVPPMAHQHPDLGPHNNICQHQMIPEQVARNSVMQRPCESQYSNTTKACPNHNQNLNSSMIMSSSTPRARCAEQDQQLQQQLTHVDTNQQYTNTSTVGAPQFHYHTIQTNQCQAKKQAAHQQHRMHSMHQQSAQSYEQLNNDQMFHVIQPATQVNARLHEFPRYANVQSIIDESIQTRRAADRSSKYQEHVYCNQKSGLTLPEYEPPPAYAVFLENKRSYMMSLTGQHMTHHSESQVSQKTKDSSYENLRRFSPYGNLGEDRQEPPLASQTWSDNCSPLLATEMKEDNGRANASLVY